MAVDTKRRVVNTTVTAKSDVDAATAGVAFDAALTVAMDAVIAAPPAGYQPGSIALIAQSIIYDGTFYIIMGGFVYFTQI
jgi:hypothetical protein